MQTNPTDSEPLTRLPEFARRYGPGDMNYEGGDLQPLDGDAGFRRYFRFSSRPSLMLVDSPPDTEKNLEYVRISDYLSGIGVRVPHIYAVDFEQGLFANEDLGDALLLDRLTSDTARELYDRAISKLLCMQAGGQRPDWMAEYSALFLMDELRLFTEWFVKRLLGIEVHSTTRAMIEQVFDLLTESALEQPQVFVHRDYHCRNLMVLDGNELATIDFQDGVWGPITYDLVSLCRDCYLRWNEDRVTATLNAYAAKLKESGILDQGQVDRIPGWFDWMGLQRHIKVLGIFSRLNLRDSKPRYLSDLPLVLRYVIEVSAGYAELAGFYQWLLDEVVPAAEKHSWYESWQGAGAQLDF